ncbi:uncharacterized protein LOC108665689 [Hyalella azteca]|uniref:Uncharacterized protein LOC108665689 n=1 Tax=Hyalella azteca TaxID=294128 RepID=A0A8B7N2A5_HYAAZ|nr:uncharacterized protein LOC108665689 [Hyalella azteca]
MDLFLLNGEPDDLSLQDMIEKDMKSELSLSTYDHDFESDMCMGAFEPLFDGLPSMDVDLPGGIMTPPASSSAHSSCSSTASSLEDDQASVCMEQSLSDITWYSGTHGKDILFDLDNAIMVNPSVVLPSSLALRVSTHPGQIITSEAATCLFTSPGLVSPSLVGCNADVSPLLTSPSPLLSSSSVMLSSCNGDNTTQSDTLLSEAQPTRVSLPSILSPSIYIKTETLQSSTPSSVSQSTSASSSQVTVLRPTVTVSSGGVVNSSLNPSTTLITSPKQLTQQQIANSLVTHHQTLGVHNRAQLSSSNGYSGNRTPHNNVVHSSDVTATSIASVHTTINNGPMFRGKPGGARSVSSRRGGDERALPKPAYSYSCLIALALKNSSSGSLPVSEIYSFMCEYFPYFRTAPNGWKNSVRHNLSLNKCFEKIEKPVVSGNNQRKGCLWALNPSKVHKMDEEIQKWSKKDLQGIRDAMSTPDMLGALERGEMKFEAASSASSCSEDDDDDDEVDALTLTEPPSSMTVLNRGSIQQTRTALHVTKCQQPAILRQSNTHRQQQILATKVSATLPSSPEYILPDSTMTEISFQTSAGGIIDSLGNEISIDDEVSSSSNICVTATDVSPIASVVVSNNVSSLGSIVASNNSITHLTSGVVTSNLGNITANISAAANVSVLSSPRSLVLRKLPLAPVRASSLRANYVYSPLGSPHGLNRLVLSNAKIA